MARRRAWKGIVIDVARSFVSRNNDVDGYWGIGKLLLYALQNRVTLLRLDIFRSDASYPPFWEAQADRYRRIIETNAEMLGLRWQEAGVELNFEISDDRLSSALGVASLRSFRCEVTVRDDLGKAWSHAVFGQCRPHDPALELQSSRAA